MLPGNPAPPRDEKNRLTLPAKLRGPFEDGVVVTFGLDGCLEAYPRATWDDVAGRLPAPGPLSADPTLRRRPGFARGPPGGLPRHGRPGEPGGAVPRAGGARAAAGR